jgi:high-affinity iron transporter
VLPGLNNLAFDVSGTVDPGSWYAALLKGTLNFTPATTVLQAVAWVLYVGTVMFFFLRPSRATAPSTPAVAAAPAVATTPEVAAEQPAAPVQETTSA